MGRGRAGSLVKNPPPSLYVSAPVQFRGGEVVPHSIRDCKVKFAVAPGIWILYVKLASSPPDFSAGYDPEAFGIFGAFSFPPKHLLGNF